VKSYQPGDHEPMHHHKVGHGGDSDPVGPGADVWSGFLRPGDIITLAPGEATDFTAVTAATTVVIKVPCVAGDK